MSRKSLDKVFKYLLYVLPVVLFFSYYPVIKLGASESMNFELSVPLLWLVIFDAVGLVAMWGRRVLFAGLKGKWPWLLLPIFLTISVSWSLNPVRGVLTVGILWLIYFAVYAMWSMRELYDAEFRRRWWKWFLGATLVACVWCVVQCVLDLAGVGREYSLMCAGCTYQMFGFPHPNGFAIEPQFMGNLLLAPAIVMAWLIIRKQKIPFCFLAISATLFLTFSRGAIYAFVVGMVFMSTFVIVRERGKWKKSLKRLGLVWGMVVAAFLFTLNVQGIMSAVSPTSDTYVDGVAKALHHLSLGVIDVRNKDAENQPGEADIAKDEVVENTVENSEENEAVFDGYVAESTDTRLRLTGVAVEAWSKNPQTVLLGVGLGGAGQALYNDGLSPSPKEIVQNEYASLLLETGVVGVLLLIVVIILVVRSAWRSPESGGLLGLAMAYGVSLLFFSGLANALQIYLIFGLLVVLTRKRTKFLYEKS